MAYEIPKLIKTKISYHETFLKADCKNDQIDFFEKITRMYPSKLLDIFSEALDASDERLQLLDSQYFRLSVESKYLNFIEDVFLINNKRCTINISLCIDNKDCILSYMNELDIIDKHILLENMQHNKRNNGNLYLIKDLNLLKLFMKGVLREVFSNVELFFENKPLLLFSNFDMSLPLVFRNKKDMDFYEKIANNHELFFR